jgi:hypothetical protein
MESVTCGGAQAVSGTWWIDSVGPSRLFGCSFKKDVRLGEANAVRTAKLPLPEVRVPNIIPILYSLGAALLAVARAGESKRAY